ncbi:hypothetical protein ABI59_20870 [Acidobacteria bacterium Mor1]|nr:hypothetical protein ABI59_20870 [Acidobacteria bacterium Mor1]
MLDRCLAGAGRLVAPRWARGLCRRLLADSAAPVSLGSLAREYGISRSQLTRGFRRSYGCSIGEFQRRIRLERAAELLACSELPIAVIAGECGFSDQAHLCRLFRGRTGRSPGGFRREAGGHCRNR